MLLKGNRPVRINRNAILPGFSIHNILNLLSVLIIAKEAYHVPEACMVVHPLLERFWEPVGANLTDVHGEHDQVEIPRNTRSRSEGALKLLAFTEL